MRNTLGALVVAAALAAGLGACASGTGAPAESLPPITGPKVDVADSVFKPETMTIRAGETITWDFVGGIPHTVTARDKSFDSKTLRKGKRYARAFTAAGTYKYVCVLHPRMTGTVVVTA